ncbi:hypothetical protein KKD37_03585 [Patescibacteria group bacterium]|nr:hypothetical protein [Patescibacteria group bacterium]
MNERISDCDHTYLKTIDNLYFCTAGGLHTRESIFGQPYYIPHKMAETLLGNQIQSSVLVGETEFCKFMDILKPGEYPDFIRENFKDYYYSPPMWRVLMKVDRTKVVAVLDPKKGRQNIMKKYEGKKDLPIIGLFKSIRQFDKELYRNTGVTGSLLLHQNPCLLKNDVDLIIYGARNVAKSKEFSHEMCTQNGRFSFLDGDNLVNYLDVKSKTYPGTREELSDLSRRRWDTFFIDGIKIDLTFSSGLKPPFPSYDMLSQGKISFKGKVTDATGSSYLPTILQVKTETGPKTVVVTSRGYICLFQPADTVQVFGEQYVGPENKEEYTIITENNQTYISRQH